jgi:hypothetical protein
MARRAEAQVVYSADEGGLLLSAGGTASGYYLNYGEQKLLGATAFIEADTRRHLGIEAEARWLEFHQTNDINAATYLGGVRYFRDYGRFQPYAKGLVGFGQANLAFSLGQANSLVIVPGGGVDYRLNRRIHLRLADFEYQFWPQATYGTTPAFSSIGVSSGIRVRIF